MKTASLVLMFLAAPCAALASQNGLDEAKAHYASAAYEDALTALSRAEAAMPPDARGRVEMEQYRVFCFIALGRITEAERAVASLVAADPRYLPSPTDASPKVLQLVHDMRQRELPAVARKLLADGRTAFQQKQFASAQRSLELLLHLLDDPALSGRAENADMRVVAEGFIALAAAAAAPPPAPEPPVETPVATTGTPVVEPPIAVNQRLPDWLPPDDVAASRDFVGAIRVTIGADGRVKAAVIETATYPSYDARLLQVAKHWLYKPALRNGQPIESEKIIAVNLRRRD